jgi:exonuclease SbcC
MILRTIHVEGWRCFAAAVEVGPLGDGLNVIHGRNGIGKSSLMMALARGLFDNHNVGGDQVKTLRPWGRQLNPKVVIEFEQDGVRYRLQKQFLSSPAAALSRLENGQFVPLAESRAADEQARQILSGDAPARGVTDQRHWGLAQILWATQGNLQIDGLSAGTRATIQDALGAQVSGPGAETLEKQIADAFNQFFTPGGKLKGGASAPAVVALQSQHDAAQTKRIELLAKLEDFDSASRRIEDLRHKTEQAKHSERELTDKLKGASVQAQQYKELLSQRKEHEHAVRAAEIEYKSLDERIKSIASTRQELKVAGEQLRRLHDDAPVQAKQVEQSRAQAEQTKKAVDAVRAKRQQVTDARQLARLAERFARTRESLAHLNKLIDDIDTVGAELNKLRAARDELIAPDKKTLDKITKTARARDDARLKLDAALITVTIVPDADVEVDVTTAEQTGTHKLAAGQPHPIKGAPEVAFHIAGVGRFQATGPTGSVHELRSEWEFAIAKLEELTAGFRTNDVHQLQQRHIEAAELDRQISQANVKQETLLGGQPVDKLRAQRAIAANAIDETLAAQPAWKSAPPDPVQLTKSADDMEQSFTTDIDRAEAENDRAQESLRLALQKQTSHDTEIKGVENQIAAIEKRLESLTADGQGDDQRAARRNQLAMQRDAAQGKQAGVEEQLKSFGDDPGKLVGVFEGQLAAVRQESSDAARQLNTEEGRLQQLAAAAPYSALAAVEEEINRLDEEIARQQLHINAVRLLHETLAERKREVLQSVLGPVRIRANQTLQRIVGTRFDDIQFDESLLPQGVAPRSSEEPVALDQLSGGEREQLHFAVRLALADVAFGNQRQLVVLDDVFTYTDTTRLARIATILDEAADRFQIVLLTCHPERYRGLPNAEFFDLERIVAP